MRKAVYFFVKRLFDILFAIFGITISSVFWLIAIVGIELSDFGPVFYVARRIGKDNKEFKMYKFRSLRVALDADESGFRADANRIFKFGAFMRATKIDELPQLLNVLIGNMSVVGPRPAAIDQVDTVRAGKYSVSASVKPGMTGPAALYDYLYGDDITDEEEYREKVLPTRLELEAYYPSNASVLLDLKMIFYTVICIFCAVFSVKSSHIYKELTSYAEENNIANEEVVT